MSADPQEDLNYVVPEEQEEAVDASTLQAQLDDLNRKLEHESSLRTEAEKQAGFWYEQTTKKLEAVEPPEPEQGFNISDEEWGEVFSDKKKFLGLIDRVATERAQTIAATVTDTKANAIMGEQRRLQSAWMKEQERLPDLGDTKAPLTQMVATKIREMQASEEYQNLDPVVALRLAVSQAEAQWMREGKEVVEDTPVPRSLNGGRNAAIAAQAGGKGRKAAEPNKFAGISADEMALMEKHAKGLGIPVEKIIANRPNVVKFRQ